MLQVCFLFEEILENSELAIRSYQEVLELEPEHAGSRRALDRLYRRTERWRDLVALLRQELDRVRERPTSPSSLLYEIGELHETEARGTVGGGRSVRSRSREEPDAHARPSRRSSDCSPSPAQRQRIATAARAAL